MRPISMMLAGALALVTVPPAAAQQKEAPPPLGTPKDFRLPAKRELTLPNGLRVTLVPFGTVPKASVRLVVRAGNADEGASETWLADLTGDLLREGTTSLTAAQLAERAAGVGGELSVAVTPDYTTIGSDVLSERTPEMVRLVADVALHPRLPESELARLKATRVRQLAIEKSQPQPVANEKFLATLYPNSPYGRVYPTEQMLQGYTIDQVRDFYAQHYAARRAHLYVAGVYDTKAVEQAIRTAFGGWRGGTPWTPHLPTPAKGRSVALIDRPDAVQSTVMIGLPVAGPQSKDFTALQVTDAILGGTFGSRITTNIREQKGYTYSPFSQLATHYHDAYWVEEADVTTKVTGPAIHEIFGEVDRLTKEAPPVDELDGVKNNMIGVFTLRNGSRAGIIGQLRFVDLQGLPDDYLTGYVKRVLAVTPQDVQTMMKTYLKPEQMAIVVVGDKKIVEEQIAPYGTVSP